MPARQAIREKVVDRLYSGYEVVRSTATGGSTSTIVDTALISGIFEANDFIGAYVWISGGSGAPDEEFSKIISFDRTDGTLTVSPVFTAGVVSTDTYEIHYQLHPARVNEGIVWAVEVGTRNALSGPTTDAGTTTLELEVIVEGTLSYCKRAIASQTRARDPALPMLPDEKSDLLAQALEHEINWLNGLALIGFAPFVGVASRQSLIQGAQ
jgi:hypothetical protein